MKIWTQVVHVWDDALQRYVVDEVESKSEEYFGPVAMCKGGGGDPPPPDPNIGNAAVKNAQLGQDWLTFAKQQFDVGNTRQAAMDALTTKVTDQQLSTQAQQAQQATDAINRYKTVFQPVQDQFVNTAQNYDSAQNQSDMAAQAKADVMANGNAQKQSTIRQMASMGINPNSGRFQAITQGGDTTTALAAAGAQNNTRQAVRDKALALKADAVNMGNGVQAGGATAASLGLNAGNAVVGNQGAANANFYANTGIMDKGYGGAMQGYSNQGNILNTQYGNQLNAWGQQQQANAAMWGGLGQAGGTVAAAMIM